MKRKWTEDKIKEMFKEIAPDYKLLEIKRDKNSHIQILIKCLIEIHEPQWVNLSHFIKGQRCKYCHYENYKNLRTWSYDEVKKYIEKYGYKLLSKECKNNSTKINIECDRGHSYWVVFNSFQQGNRCPVCNKTKKKTHNEYLDLVKNKTDGEYLVLSRYINSTIKVKHQHVKCGHIFGMSPNSFIQGQRCPNCSPNKKKNTEIYKKQLFDLIGNEYKITEDYINNDTKIKHLHIVCGYEYLTSPHNFLSGHGYCPLCNGSARLNTELYKAKLSKLYPGEYQVLDEFIKGNIKIKHKHNKCNTIFEIAPSMLLNKHICPTCQSSKGEIYVNNFLKNNNIINEPQFSFDDLLGINNGFLLFDFAIFDNNKLYCLIEVDGEFHRRAINKSGKGEEYSLEKFKIQKEHDKRKDEYCKKNNIKLIRIPYYEKIPLFEQFDDILNNNLKCLIKEAV